MLKEKDAAQAKVRECPFFELTGRLMQHLYMISVKVYVNCLQVNRETLL